MGLAWAFEGGIPVKLIKPEWDKLGKSAGMERNVKMARYARECEKGGALVALWDGSSRGTKHMIRVAKMQGLEVFVKTVKK